MTHTPRLYCASKFHNAFMWRNWKEHLPNVIEIVSTWHDNLNIAADDLDENICRREWIKNRTQILYSAEHFLAYGSRNDALNGTLVEIGMALAADMNVHLVGTYPWATWRHMRQVKIHQSLHHALLNITKSEHIDFEGVTLNDTP